mmetsp:Transcript_31267/g.51616  ORF Transcript_31267/g.51616 Transcript_31267/m.51616 type:complete len:114 (+) Transcript_31267:1741-2082(+)
MTAKTVASISNSNVRSNGIVPTKEVKLLKHTVLKPLSRTRIAPEPRARSAASPMPYRDLSRGAKKDNNPNPIAAIPAVIIIIKTLELFNRIIRGSFGAIAVFIKSLRARSARD